jgi:2'-5' RNA ligase
MALLTLKVPHDVARVWSQLEVPGDREPVGETHITLVYIGEDTPISEVAKAIEAVYSVTSQTKPFTVMTSLVTSFTKGEDGIPIIAKIESPELVAFQAKLKAALQDAGIEFNDKFPEYKPHVTLSYLKEDEAPEDYNFPAVEWGVAEMILWGGDQGDEKLAITFPFNIIKAKEARFRAYVRLAGQAVDGKKLLAKLLAAAKKDWAETGIQTPMHVHGESLPMRGGYGPYEAGEILVGKFRIKLVFDHKDGTLGIGVYSGPHALESMMSRGTPKDALARLKKPLDFIKQNMVEKVKSVQPEALGMTPESVTQKLKRITLGPAGRVRSVEFEGGQYPLWSIEPQDRQRLDHFVGRHYHPGEDDDPEGWDSEGWEDEYAGPIRRVGQPWLDREFGKGNFVLDVGEKGHVEIQPTVEGKKLLRL